MDALPAVANNLTWPAALVLGAWILGRGPLGDALAEKLRRRNGNGVAKEAADMATLRAEVSALSQSVSRVERQSQERDEAMDTRLGDAVSDVASQVSQCRADIARMSGQLEGLPERVAALVRG